MPVLFKCPNAACGKTMKLPDSAVGKRVKCPKCSQPLHVTTAQPIAAAAGPGGTARFGAGASKCPACNSSVPESAVSCVNCGFQLQADSGSGERERPRKICVKPGCGSANPPTERICLRCGEPLPLPDGTLLLGRYRLDKLLKIGGFGAVYRGIDIRQGNRPVAVKDMIVADPRNLDLYRNFFRREAQILRALEGMPIVPRLYDYIDQGETAHLVMEFIRGKDLLDIMALNGNQPFPMPLVIEWGQAICDVLDTMHHLSPPIIHRDLKPDNIMLLEDQRSIKMIDFGAARELGRTAEERAAKKTGLYTEGYAPAEQQVERRPEVRSDLFALAATLYHLATGKEPEGSFTGNVIGIQLADASAPIPAPYRWFFDLLRINLSAKAEDRYPSASQIKTDLQCGRVTLVAQGSPFELDYPDPVAQIVEPAFVMPIVEAEPARPRDPFAELRIACQAAPPDWAHIFFLASDAVGAGHVIPTEYSRLTDEAQSRSVCVQRLLVALNERNLRAIAEAYQPEYLDDWPTYADEVVKAKHARACLKKLREMETLLQKTRTGRTLLKRWVQVEQELAPWSESEPIRRAVTTWKARLRGLEKFQRVLEEKTPSERAITQAWESLKEVGGHPDAAALHERVQQAYLRAACMEAFPPKRIPESVEEDALMLRAWDQQLLQDCPEAENHRGRYEQACRRLQLVDELQAIIAQADEGLAQEQAVLDAEGRLPRAYIHGQADRVAAAQERVRVGRLLKQVLRAKPLSDHAIAVAWDQAQKAGLRMGEATKLRCERADQRRQCLSRLGKIDRRAPWDEQDQQWLALWNAELLEACADADPLRPAHAKALARVAAWRALESALERKDLDRILPLAADPLLVDYPPVVRVRAELQDLMKQAESLQRMKDLLSQSDVNAFVKNIDFEYIRTHPDLFWSQREAIAALLTRWLHEGERVSKSPSGPTQDWQTGRFLVPWTWPQFGRISHCRVAVSPHRCFQTLEEAGGKTMHWDAEAHRRAGGGIEVSPLPGQRRLFVTVWPAIDLGWRELVGPPLQIGPIVFK